MESKIIIKSSPIRRIIGTTANVIIAINFILLGSSGLNSQTVYMVILVTILFIMLYVSELKRSVSCELNDKAIIIKSKGNTDKVIHYSDITQI